MRCDAVGTDLAEAAAGRALLSGDERRHVEHCLRCQAEMAQQRKLSRALASLRTEVMQPPVGLLADILAALDGGADQRAIRLALRGRRGVYVGGLAAAATAAAAGGAIVLASRSRRRVRLAS